MDLQQFSVPNVERIAISQHDETVLFMAGMPVDQKKARQKAGLK